MADYKFDGRWLTERSRRIAELRGNDIYDARHSRVGKINGEELRDRSNRRIARFDGRSIRDSSNRVIGDMGDVERAIDGIGGMSLVAMWVFFVR